MSDTQYTVLQIINEVQRKLGLNATATLVANKLSIQLVDFLNDTCTDISDFGNWQEMLVSANIVAVSGQCDYSINTSANVKNIGDIYFRPRTGSLKFVTVANMRIMTRVTNTGAPSQFTIFGADANANPNIRVRPTPAAAENGELFSIIYYTKPQVYTISDAATVVHFPGEVVVNGVLARAILNESGGSPTDKYSLIQQDYLTGRKEALNRFNGDTGWDVSFVPSRQGRRR